MRSAIPAIAASLLSGVIVFFFPEQAFSEQGLQGRLVLSDGTVLDGEILTRGNLPIRLYALDSKRFRRVHLSEMKGLRVSVTKAEQVKEFDWVEMGSDEKIFTGKTYPRKDFEGRIELLSGERLTGHLLGVVYVRIGEDVRKFELTRYARGETGQTLGDLVHVKEIVFSAGGERTACALKLLLRPYDKKARAFVLGSASPVFWDAGHAGAGSMEVRNLAPGTYDFVVLSGKILALGLSIPEQAKGGGPLTPEVEKALRERASEIQNFFTSKEIVLLNGTDLAARALVKMVRTEKSSYDSKGGRQRFFRFEIWTMTKVGERWLVDSRTFVTRGKDPIDSDDLSEPAVRRVAALEGLHVGDEAKEAEAVLDMEAMKEK